MNGERTLAGWSCGSDIAGALRHYSKKPVVGTTVAQLAGPLIVD
jgi:hypothetical protein